MKRRRKNNRKIGCLFILILIVLIITFTVSKCSKEKTVPLETTSNYNSSKVNTEKLSLTAKNTS